MLTDEQHRVRRGGIGGSDIAALCGLSQRWRPIDVYLSKIDVLPAIQEDADNEDCNRGNFLESGVRAWYAHKRRCYVEEVGTLKHAEHRLVLATPDGIAKFADGTPDRPLEIKCPRFGKSRDWSAGNFPHDLKVPAYYLCQTMWEMAVTGAQYCDVAVLLGDELHIIAVPFDKALYDNLRNVAEAFWDNCVLPQKPPQPDDSPSYGDYLRRLYPSAKRAEMLTGSADMLAWAKRYKETTDAIADMEKQRRLARSHLEQHIADASGIDFGRGAKITYTSNKDSERIDVRALIDYCKIDKAAIAACSTTKPGPRVFRPSLDGLGDII